MFTKLIPVLRLELPRLASKSTVLGLLSLASIIGGFVIAPDRMAAIATAVSAVAGVALVFVNEAPSVVVSPAVVADVTPAVVSDVAAVVADVAALVK